MMHKDLIKKVIFKLLTVMCEDNLLVYAMTQKIKNMQYFNIYDSNNIPRIIKKSNGKRFLAMKINHGVWSTYVDTLHGPTLKSCMIFEDRLLPYKPMFVGEVDASKPLSLKLNREILNLCLTMIVDYMDDGEIFTIGPFNDDNFIIKDSSQIICFLVKNKNKLEVWDASMGKTLIL